MPKSNVVFIVILWKFPVPNIVQSDQFFSFLFFFSETNPNPNKSKPSKWVREQRPIRWWSEPHSRRPSVFIQMKLSNQTSNRQYRPTTIQHDPIQRYRDRKSCHSLAIHGVLHQSSVSENSLSKSTFNKSIQCAVASNTLPNVCECVHCSGTRYGCLLLWFLCFCIVRLKRDATGFHSVY